MLSQMSRITPKVSSCGLLYNLYLTHLTLLSRPKSTSPSYSHFSLDDNEQQHHTTIYHYSAQLQQCSESTSLSKAKTIHSKLIKSALVPSTLFLHNHLLNAYFKCFDRPSATRLFDEMPKRNVVSWASVISGFEKLGFFENAISAFCAMRREGFRPNGFTFSGAFQACSLDPLLYNFPFQIRALVIRFGFESDIFVLNAYLTALIRHNQFQEASDAFEKSWFKDIFSWNTMLAGYLQTSKLDIPGFWYRMNRAGIEPDNFTFSSVLTGLADLCYLDLGVQVHGQLVKSGHISETCVGNSLVDMYLKNRKIQEGNRAFDEIPVRDVRSWTQMASRCLSCGEPSSSLAVIGEMRKMGIKPNKFTIATMLNACANIASLEEGKKVHGLSIKLGDEIDVCADNALVDMYAKCGSMDTASMVFQSMGERSVVSWTSMIMGYAQNGETSKAIQLFDEMTREGTKPNYVTFIAVLYACSQGGFVEEGWKHFHSMGKDFGISPGEDHYVCMVDLLGRVGRIREAEDLIISMPFEASVLVWKTLLGACRVHGDVETAIRAAKRAIDLDRDDPSTYVLVSNMLAGMNNWDCVGMLREVMGSRDVKKMPATSWIEINHGNDLARGYG